MSIRFVNSMCLIIIFLIFFFFLGGGGGDGRFASDSCDKGKKMPKERGVRHGFPLLAPKDYK